MDGIILKKYILLLFAGDTVEAPQGALVPELHFDTTGLEIIWFKCLPGKLCSPVSAITLMHLMWMMDPTIKIRGKL